MKQNMFAAADRGNFLDWKEHSRFVVRPHRGNDSCVRPDGFLQFVNIQAAVRFHWQERDLKTHFLEMSAEFDVRRMLDGGSDDMPFLRMGDKSGVKCRIIALSPATREYKFARFSINQVSDFLPGIVERPVQLFSETVNARRISP